MSNVFVVKHFHLQVTPANFSMLSDPSGEETPSDIQILMTPTNLSILSDLGGGHPMSNILDAT